MAHKTDVKTPQQKAEARARAVIIMAVAAAFFVILSVVLALLTPGSTEVGQTGRKSVFGVQSVEVVGDTRYYPESIIGVSGIYVGKSVFSINKDEVAENLLDRFPYFETVKVESEGLGKILICVTEKDPVGAFYAGGNWNYIDANGRLLEAAPVESNDPPHALHIKGITLAADPVPGAYGVLDERSAKIVADVAEGIGRYSLTDVKSLDLTDRQNICLDWQHQVLVRLGGDSNLIHEIGVTKSALQRVVATRGSGATGELNVSAYSNSEMESQAIFTPSNLL